MDDLLGITSGSNSAFVKGGSGLITLSLLVLLQISSLQYEDLIRPIELIFQDD
jgi:hypothetical protein